MDQSISTTKFMVQKEFSTDKINDGKLLANKFTSNLGQNFDVESTKYTSLESSIWFEDSPQSTSIDDLQYNSHRGPWLRALIFGANDGLVSIASLMLGIGAISKTYDGRAMVVNRLAGLIAGACSMAIGELVFVFSQCDKELADLEKQWKKHLSRGPLAQAQELEELTQIYVGRGINYFLAKQACARDKLGIDIKSLANPLQAAIALAIAFALGGTIQLLSGSFIANFTRRIVSIVIASTLALVGFGALGAWLGGATMGPAAIQILIGGWIAMLITYGMLKLIKVAGVSS